MAKIYLMRHAEAESGLRMDPTRALTEQGREQVKLMGEFLVRQIGRVDLVVSSNFKRAFDTARGMADLLGCEIVETSPALDPDGKPAIAWSDVEILTGAYCPETADAHVLVVSHHPLIGELAQYLCGVKTSDEKFHHAAVMHIHGSGPGSVMGVLPSRLKWWSATKRMLSKLRPPCSKSCWAMRSREFLCEWLGHHRRKVTHVFIDGHRHDHERASRTYRQIAQIRDRR